LTLPDVAMELPSHFPSDYWNRGPGPSSAHPFGVEVSNNVKFALEFIRLEFHQHEGNGSISTRRVTPQN